MATFYDYENRTALDPYTGAGAPNAVGQVFAKTDTTFSTPLTVVLMGSGLQATDMQTDQYSQLPGFQVEDHLQVVFKSGDFTKVLNTTTPLIGPQGAAVAEAVDNGDNTVTFMLEDGTPAATVTLPEGPQGNPGPQGLPATNAAQDDAALTAFATTTGTQFNTALNATYARQTGGVVSAADPKFAGGVSFTKTAEQNRAALQAAIDSLKGLGGTVTIPAPESPVLPAAFMAMDTVTLWARINLRGASKLGARLQAKAGIKSAIIKVGATDGSDPNWHWGEVSNLYLDGNKANQTAMPLVTVTGASSVGYVVTLTTATAHGFTVGDVVDVAGILPDAYNGQWRVDTVPSPTTFTYGILVNNPAASTQGGTAQVMLNLINVAEAGETSVISSVYGNGAFNSGVHQGTNGTPMRYENVSMFHCNDYGFDLWSDRPIQMDTPSGDFNGKALIRMGGKSSAGGSGTDSVVAITNIKAEHHLVPALLLDDYDGSVVVNGGSIDMETGNTAPPIRRTAKSSNSTLDVAGLRINKRASGAIFEDLSPAALSVTTAISSADTYTFHVSKTSFNAIRYSQRRNNLIDAATITPNLQNGTICIIGVNRAARTIAAPLNAPLGAPNAQFLTFDLKNDTAATTATTWDPIFKIGGWVDPAPGKRRTVMFWYDGINWVQMGSVSPDL